MTISRSLSGRLTGGLWVVLVGGCEPTAESTVLVVQQPVRPTLASDRDSQITLFGGLPNREEPAYAGRSRGAMLQHSFTQGGADFDCHLNSDGSRFVFASTRHSEHPDLYVKSVEGTAVMQATSDPSSDIQPAFSPDDQRIAFASNRTGNWDIWVIDVEGMQPIQVTHSPMDEVHPSWSPDGSQLVYCAMPPTSGQWELWIAPAAEHAPATFVGYGVFPEWSPVDDRIVFQRSRHRGGRWYSIWIMTMTGGEPRYPTEIAYSPDHALILPAWSRDGAQVAYTTVASIPDIDPEFGQAYQTSDIWTIQVDGGSAVRLTDAHTVNFGPAWSPDGRVFFSSGRTGNETIWSIMPAVSGDAITPLDGSGPASRVTTTADRARDGS